MSLSQFRTLLPIFVFIGAVISSGCGGGGGQTPSNEALSRDTNNGYSIRITLLDETTRNATTSISPEQAGLILIQVEQFGRPKASEIVNLDTTLGEIGVSNGALLTNDNGQAEVRIVAEGTDGAGTITASIDPEDAPQLSVNLNFFSSGGASISDEDPDNLSISISLLSNNGITNTIRGDDPGVATARVINQSGTPISNEIVTFSSELGLLNPTTGTVLTDSDGIANIQVSSGNTIGVSTLFASIGEEPNSVVESLNFSIEPPRIQFGNDSTGTFVEGTLGLGMSNLSAGGTVSVSATVVDENGLSFSTPVEITFNSTCVTQNLATIDETVTSVNGRASATYRATGCIGPDFITASIDFGGAQFNASTTLTVQSDSVGSIVFTETIPNTIVLAGTGGQGLSENASVTFQVFGQQGMPLANQQVDFSLTTNVGGISLSPETAISDANGFVTTQVQSGSVATSVVIIATLRDTDISTQSTSLVVSSGVPDQDSMTISLSQLNPEAFSLNGTEINVTAFAADHFNNPVPDGITFSFTVEGGQIQPSCISENGSCSVTWTSQNPRPAGGFVTMMVTAVGGESFQDENGNGVFDEGDGFDDLTEAFRDDNEDTVRDFGEPFIDFNVNGQFDLADGLYNGPLCEDPSRCATEQGVSVRDSHVFIMSGSIANISLTDGNGGNYESLDPLSLIIQDVNGNSMPGGSTISISSNIGEIISTTSFEINLRTTRRFENEVRVNLDGVDPPTGLLFITILVTTPSGAESSESFQFNYDVSQPDMEMDMNM